MGKEQITGTTVLTGLLGHPVSHSISPLMHNEAFGLLGLDYAYLCFDVGEESLKTAMAGLKALGARGFNLTMPDKNKALSFVDEVSQAGRMIGAINTVLCEDGRLKGYNTDGIGYMRALADASICARGREVTLLGGGGAATAISVQAAIDGAERLNIFTRPNSRFESRTRGIVDAINRETGCEAQLFDLRDEGALKKCLGSSALLINATSVGMAPDTDQSLITDTSMFHKDLIVSDIIYNPRQTRLLALADRAGLRTANGLYMLLYQGAEAFRLWTGREMPVAKIKAKYFR